MSAKRKLLGAVLTVGAVLLVLRVACGFSPTRAVQTSVPILRSVPTVVAGGKWLDGTSQMLAVCGRLFTKAGSNARILRDESVRAACRSKIRAQDQMVPPMRLKTLSRAVECYSMSVILIFAAADRDDWGAVSRYADDGLVCLGRINRELDKLQ